MSDPNGSLRPDPGPPSGMSTSASPPPPPPTPSVVGSKVPTYSERLRGNINRNERLKRNVLEINLDFDVGVNTKIENDTVSKLIKRMGIDMSTQVEAVQTCPGNSRKIYIWLKNNVDISKFCSDESFKVADGIKTGFIKPMDKSEVAVLIKGLNLNTPDTLVLDYLAKHGKVANDKVIYVTEKEGPMKGIKNGDRKYLIDFSGGRNLGSYHIIDGVKVMISYSGQIKTCGRCHKTSRDCIGGGYAKQCELKNGPRVNLGDHMAEHWKNINFSPSNFKLFIDGEMDSKVADSEIKKNQNFTPTKIQTEEENDPIKQYSGVVIKNLPLTMPENEILKFLQSKGLGMDHKDIKIKRNKKSTAVDIENIENKTSEAIIENLNEKIIFNQKIYCRGLRSLESPPKSTTEEKANEESTETKEGNHVVSDTGTPGLSIDEAKKALKKAAKLKKSEKKKTAADKPKKLEDMKKDDFLSKDVMNEFVFDNSDDSDSDEDPNDGQTLSKSEGFFTISPLANENLDKLLSPSSFRSQSANRIQKEELRRKTFDVKPANKRRASQEENPSRKIRAKSVSRLPVKSS